MIDIFINILTIAGCFFTLFGMFIFFAPMFKMKSPMDRSNLINAIIAPIYTALHPDTFAGMKFWRNDIGDNVRMVEDSFKEKKEQQKS